MTVQDLLNALPEIGLSSIFLYMLKILWDYVRDQQQKMLDAFKENTKVIEKNTTLTELIYQELRGKQ